MLDRIPINLSIRSTKFTHEDIIARFCQHSPFYPKELCRNYFSFIVTAILDDLDPMSIIQKYIPEIEEQIYVNITVIDASEQYSGKELVFIYTEVMTDDAFHQECTRIKSKIIKGMTLMKKTTFGALQNLFGFPQTTPEHANLQFVLGNYAAAKVEYGGIYRQFPELSKRMCEICRVILHERAILEPLAFDVLIQDKRYNELYELSGILPFDAKLAIRYYLLSKEKQKLRKMILLNECIDGFEATGDRSKIFTCRDEMVKVVNDVIIEEPFNELFWREYLSVISYDSETTLETII